MKKSIPTIVLCLTGTLTFLLSACRKEFLDRPPIDAITLDNFYSSAAQVNTSTAPLYGNPWFDMNDKTLWALGDVAGGNLTTFDGAVVSFKTFDVTADNTRLAEAWRSMFNVIAQSNSIMNNLPTRVSPSVDAALVQRCLGESRFMRALAYFYLVRTFGAVPLIENNLDHVYSPQIPKNTVDDVYKFILRDLEFVEANCPLRSSYGGVDKARVSSGTAKALMAKVYLYRKDYLEARTKAEEVVNSGEYELMPEYADIFMTKNNVNQTTTANKETIFALLWEVDNDGWGVQNTNQAYFAPSGQNLTGFADGWGSASPSIDLQQAYEPGDKRKKATIMSPGDNYPELRSDKGGYSYPTTEIPSGTRASIKKYVVGAPVDNNNKGGFMRTYINTNILRLAEIYLIAAEAIMNGAASTSDAKALEYFNKVRQRAGLPVKTTITADDILKERRVELAVEADYWFDLGRIDRAKAIAILSNQERGTYGAFPAINSGKFVPGAEDFIFPIPSAEVSKNSKLIEEPVPYTFK